MKNAANAAYRCSIHQRCTVRQPKISIRYLAMFPAKVLMLFTYWNVRLVASKYVGKSKQPSNKRLNDHRSYTSKKPLLPVSWHFKQSGHKLDYFNRMQVLYYSQTRTMRISYSLHYEVKMKSDMSVLDNAVKKRCYTHHSELLT